LSAFTATCFMRSDCVAIRFIMSRRARMLVLRIRHLRIGRTGGSVRPIRARSTIDQSESWIYPTGAKLLPSIAPFASRDSTRNLRTLLRSRFLAASMAPFSHSSRSILNPMSNRLSDGAVENHSEWPARYCLGRFVG
jgi:hypothetical protein